MSHQKSLPSLTPRGNVQLPTTWGTFTVQGFIDNTTQHEHLAIYIGDLNAVTPWVRVHSECLTGEVLGSLKCDCKPQLDQALQKIQERGQGMVIYLRGQEGRGIGLVRKLEAYALQEEQGLDTVAANEALGLPVDSRDYGVAAAILNFYHLDQVALITNNPEKQKALEAFGIKVVERVPSITPGQKESANYLNTKRDRMGHWL